MKKLYVVDLSKSNFDIKIHDSEVIYINSGNINVKNSKILKLNNLVKNKNIKKLFIESINKKLKLKKDFFLKEFEIYNIRNDKNIFISKILNYLKLKKFIKKNFNKYDVHCISDNQFTIDILNQITKKQIKNEYFILDKNRVDTINHNLSFFKFVLKVLLLVFITKIFNQKKIIKKLNNKKNWAVSLFPNFYKSQKEFFFGKKFNKINFLFSDESHLNHSLLKIIKIYFANRKCVLNMESFINYKDILLAIKNKLYNNIKYKNFLTGTLKIDELDFTKFYQVSNIASYINRSKLTIYNQAIVRFKKLYNIKEFHLYLFEYNFGFYLIRHFKKSKCKIIGYQHGVFDQNFLWIDLVTLNKDKIFYPNTIVSNYPKSLQLYKIKYKNDVTKYLHVKKKISKIAHDINIKTNNQNIIKVLLVAGTHDIKDIYNFCKNELNKNKKYRFYIKTHPKNKFLFNNERCIKKINNLKKYSFQKVFISSTSTIGYDLSILNKRFTSYLPDYKSC